MASPGKLTKPLEIYIGDTFNKLLKFFSDEAKTKPINLTGYAFKGQIRKCKSDTNVIFQFESPATIQLTDPTNGRITLIATSTATAALDEQNAVFDMNWTDTSGDIRTVLEGKVQIKERVTK